MLSSVVRNINQNKTTIFIMVVLIFWGFILRFYNLSFESLWIDEGFNIMKGQAISENGYALLMSGNVEYKDLFYPYLTSFISFVFSDKSFFIFRLISVFFGTASIFLIYLVSKKLFLNTYLRLIPPFLLCFSYWHIAWSRQIKSYSALVFFVLLILFFVLKYEKNKEFKYILFIIFSVFVTILIKTSFGLLILICTSFYFVLKKVEKKWLLFYSIFFVLLLLIFKKPLLNAVGFNFSLTSNFLFYLIGYFWDYFGLVFLVALPGFYLAITKKRDLHYHFFSASLVLISLIFFSFFSFLTQRRYLFFVTPIFFIYIVYFLEYLGPEVRLFRNKIWSISFFLILIISIDLFVFKSFVFIPQDKYLLEDYTPQPNFKLAYDYVKKESPYVLISPYPYMDYIYLNKFDYSLPISYTGKLNEPSLFKKTEYFTNAHRIFTCEELNESSLLDKKVLVILDSMALARVQPALIDCIKKTGRVVFKSSEGEHHEIYIYEL